MAHLDEKKVLEFVERMYCEAVNATPAPLNPVMLMYKAVVEWDQHLRDDFTWGMTQDNEQRKSNS